MSNQPQVCVVILNWNGLDDTLQCLENLQKISYTNYEVVVVDNGSANNEAATICQEYPKVHLIQNSTNLGYTGGCNQGIEYGLTHGADYILLLNNDTIPQKNSLDKLVAFADSTPNAGPLSPVILYDDRKTIWFAGATTRLGITRHAHKGELLDAVHLPEQPFITESVPGTAMLVRAKLLQEIGLFDNTFFAYYEDVDLCRRAKRAGYEAYVVPGSIIYHKKSASTGQGGRHRFGKLPAYYLARNAALLGSEGRALERVGYAITQTFVKLPLSLILLVQPKAWGSYMKGLFVGLGLLIAGRR